MPLVPAQGVIVDREFSRRSLDRCTRRQQTARSERAPGDCTLDIAWFANPFVVPLTFPNLYIQKSRCRLSAAEISGSNLQLYSAKLWRGNASSLPRRAPDPESSHRKRAPRP